MENPFKVGDKVKVKDSAWVIPYGDYVGYIGDIVRVSGDNVLLSGYDNPIHYLHLEKYIPNKELILLEDINNLVAIAQKFGVVKAKNKINKKNEDIKTIVDRLLGLFKEEDITNYMLFVKRDNEVKEDKRREEIRWI